MTEWQVGASLDDAMSNRVATWWTSIDWVEIATIPYDGGVRFTLLSALEGATITSAYLKIYIYSASYDALKFNIYGHDVDDAPTFGSGELVNNRTKTTAFVLWDEDNVGIGWQTSPDIKTVIQELADDRSLDALSLLLIDQGSDAAYGEHAAFRSWDFDTTLAAKLEVSVAVAKVPLKYTPHAALCLPLDKQFPSWKKRFPQLIPPS